MSEGLLGGLKRLDGYTVHARVAPVYLTLLPCGIAFAVAYPDVSVPELLASVIIAPAVLARLLAEVGRDFGRRKQSRLWDSWGGPPATRFLQHRNTEFNSVARQRCHARAQQLCPSIPLPTAEEEAADPDSADEAYSAYVQYLIGRTRDAERFPLILKENTSYGYRRNLWGLKAIGLFTTSAALVAIGFRVWLERQDLLAAPPEVVMAAVLVATLLACWVAVVTPAWVHVPAKAYAERLFEACDELEPSRQVQTD